MLCFEVGSVLTHPPLRSSLTHPGGRGGPEEAGPAPTKILKNQDPLVRLRIQFLNYACIRTPPPVLLLMATAQKNITLNFHEAFLERLDAYAERNGMKRNAVLKKAFELLEDQKAPQVQEAPGDQDY